MNGARRYRMCNESSNCVPNSLRNIAWSAILLVVVLCSAALAGWIFGIPVLKGIRPDWEPMSLTASLLLILSAIGSAAIFKNPVTPHRSAIVFFMPGMVVSFVGLLTLMLYALAMSSPHDESVIVNMLRYNLFDPGIRVAVTTAILFLVTGCVLTLLATGDAHLSGIAHVLMVPVAVVSYIVPVSYLLGVQAMHEWFGVPMALNTGIAFCALSVTIFCVRPDTWLMSIFIGSHAGSVMARRLLPPILVIPLLIAWLWLHGERTGVFASHIGVVLAAILYTFSLLWLLWVNARSVNRTDMHREAAEHALRQSERKLRLFIDNSPVAIAMLDHDMRYMAVSRRWLTDSGLHDQDIIGRSYYEIFPDIPEKWKEIHERCLAGATEKCEEDPVVRTDGKTDWIRWEVIPWYRYGMDIGGIIIYSEIITERKLMKEAALLANERLKIAQHAAGAGVWDWDITNDHLQWSPELFELFGLDKETPVASFEVWRNAVHPRDREMASVKIDRALKEHAGLDSEYRIINPDGEIHWINALGHGIYDDHGKAVRMTGICIDITRRKQAEQRLQESEERFRGLAESMTELVWISDADGGLIYCNPRYVEYTGMKNTSFEERMEIIHPDDRTALQEKFMEALTSGDMFQCTYRIRHHDGEYRWFLVHIRMLRNDRKRVVRWIGTATDIDDLMRTERILKEYLDILAEAERIGQTGSWKRDLATNHTTWSSGTRRIFRIPEDQEISFGAFKSLIHPDDRDTLLGKLDDIAKNGTSMTAEFRITLPDGTIRNLSARGEATLDSAGRPVHLHGTVQDITERKMLEDDLIRMQKLDSIGTLAGGMAHDYNNLLTAIMGNIELAKFHMGDTDSRTYTILTKAEQAALSARNLTQQLITFAQGGYPVKKTMGIKGLLNESVSLALSGSNTRTELKIADHLPEVTIDENQIRQVIQNIVINAREAMPGGGTLSIEAGTAYLESDNPLSMAAGLYARLTFRDEGTGIPFENLPKIFDPYYTTKNLGTEKGMGLGLSICYSIIKRHEGHITVDSEVGVGTTVTLFIPA